MYGGNLRCVMVLFFLNGLPNATYHYAVHRICDFPLRRETN